MTIRIFEGKAERNGPGDDQVTRRGFLRAAAGFAGGVTALAAALEPLRHLSADDLPSVEEFLQKHYKEMSPEEMERALERIRGEVEARHGVRPALHDARPIDGVEFVYALNISRCIGCRRCVHACVQENNQSRSPEIQYIRVLEMPRGTMDIEKGDHHYERPTVPDEDHFYLPVQCHQCANPPCVKVCPVEATWKDDDGIVVIDYDWCIGCRYCEAACPYWARRFNFAEPSLPSEEVNPDMAYLSNRPRSKGVMEKCHYCLHRTREGRMPACLEACPTGARKFGNVLDPESEVSQLLKTKRIFVLKEEVGTLPRFFYYFDERYPSAEQAASADPAGYLVFLRRCFALSFVGDWRYYAWMLALTAVALIGLNAYCRQLVEGLVVTGMTDQVSWGFYIANFTFLVGMAAAAVMLVIPVYIYGNRELHDLVIFGELFAVAAIIMALLFVTVDLGRPDRFHHLLLRFNFPVSMLTWDVIVLNGYLLLNMHICGYLIYCAYRRRAPSRAFYIPFVFIAIVWAISIHTVTAFLYSGLGGRPFWNSAVIAPRFLASAFAAGPAFLILTLQVIGRVSEYHIPPKALLTLRNIVTVAMTINVFLLGSEVFTEFYTDSAHVASSKYLFFGLHGHDALVPWIWAAIALDLVSLGVLFAPISRKTLWLNIACVMLIVGVWIEKGMGLIIPAFVPTPLGEIVEYTPTLNEIFVTLGIWAGGLLLYTILVRITVPVLSGRLVDEHVSNDETAPRRDEQSESEMTT